MKLGRLMKGKVIVHQLEKGQRVSKGGILIPDDNAKEHGIRPRWAQVYKIADDITDISVGEWVLLEHGRWTFTITIETDDNPKKQVWQIDYPDGILAVSDKPSSDFSPISE